MLGLISNYLNPVPVGSAKKRDYNPESPKAVYNVFHALKRKLPPELVIMILDAAEYWPRQTIEKAGNIRVDESKSPFAVATLVVKTNSLHPRPVRKVRLAMESHDQGWVSRPDHGSWSWFDVAVVLPGGTEQILVERIVTNAQAERKARSHEVVWNSDIGIVVGEGKDGERVGEADDADTSTPNESIVEDTATVDVPQDLASENSTDERGKNGVIGEEKITIRDTVRAIVNGTTIRLVAMARYGGWQNQVSYSRIDVFIPAIH